MIPYLSGDEETTTDYQSYLTALAQAGFKGDIAKTESDRVVASVDNSVYQLCPQAVLYPKSKQDIILIFKLSNQEKYHQIKFTPRGGGTGTNGQSLTNGIIIDTSRFLNRIIDFDEKNRQITVEPGVVLDQLNEYLLPYHLFFAPTLSPSNRATLGGMCNTDASGKGSLKYGKTSQNILALEIVLADGSYHHIEIFNELTFHHTISKNDSLALILKTINQIVSDKAELIQQQFPELKRFMTGYNLAKVKAASFFDLIPIISGSEGTLCFVTSLTLKLLPQPCSRIMLLVKYANFEQALSHARELIKLIPDAIETLDETVLNLAKEDIIYEDVKPIIERNNQGNTRAINLIEFTFDYELIDNEFIENIQNKLAKNQSTFLGYDIITSESDIDSFWQLRKKSVGLLGHAKGLRKPIAFIEDTVVPPENLCDYVKELRELLDSHGLTYGMFGHIDVGCLHVRPALNLRDVGDHKIFTDIIDKTAQLTKKYGGVLWGEHGKGFRSEYVPMFFGRELFHDLCKIKAVFDPNNQLNPGKIAVPAKSNEKLIAITDVKFRGEYDSDIKEDLAQTFMTALDCNGNAACMNYRFQDVMCPSAKITRNAIHSPRGRLNLIRHWLNKLSAKPQKTAWVLKLPFINFICRFLNSCFRKKVKTDFSYQVLQAMSGCLGCKGCATQCPIQVDVPHVKAHFLALYYSRYTRSLGVFFSAHIETIAKWQSYFPRVNNTIIELTPIKKLITAMTGLTHLPSLSYPTVKKRINTYDLATLIQQFTNQNTNNETQSVILLQDAVTTFYEANLVEDYVNFLQKLGFKVYCLSYFENGKPLHGAGKLDHFQKLALRNMKNLSEIAKFNIPIIGIEPSITLTYRDEYLKQNPTWNVKIQLIEEWLIHFLDVLQTHFTLQKTEKFYLFSHCTEQAFLPHGKDMWCQIFNACSISLQPIQTGCCGMAGLYGHSVCHQNESQGIFNASWLTHLNQLQACDTVLATGYSCRSQVKKLSTHKVYHPISILNQLF